MQIYPLNEVLTAPYLISEFQPHLIENLWNQIDPDKVKIVVIGKKVESKTNSEEHWYGTKFYCENITEETLNVRYLIIKESKVTHHSFIHTGMEKLWNQREITLASTKFIYTN
jgi:hypothetical protein